MLRPDGQPEHVTATTQAERKRKARSAGAVQATSEEFVGRSVDTQKAAAEAAEAVVSFLQDFERLSDEQQQREAAGEEEALAAPAAASDTERDRGLAGSEDAATADEAEADGEAGTALAAALEAASCCLQVLSAPGLPTQLYREELVTALVSLVKFHLQYNLLVLYDLKYRRLYRPSSMSLNADGDHAEGAERKGKGAQPKKQPKLLKQASLAKVTHALAALQGRVELLLSLLSRALGRCRAEPELLLPLGRVAMQVLPLEGAGEGLALLQLQAAAV
ncbi:hypothetical protein MNEG_6096 [Monoraphidium neglectum]|uniref:Uncharacterized protein n=1 Tax=Monoraphidium neglectum TaxID=145388 RepID=A0A0D2MMS4_9CHLO|nr:hypothetical protein MNEG_6096 [Monoraphidium neglectum]KIZ01862.1 hypothetical protein MNEG_6096 [Monoraphidium neglectum]|eukprot:XP_013900881.1 hypothetical protein MNEG_6096 [Monoraphidium neglectum]